MTCRRAFEADLAAVLHGDGDPDFLAHAETCAECAAEVGVWRELDGLLHAGAAAPGSAAHPEPETLVAFVDAAGSLSSDVRTTIERHVAGCRGCADEVRALRGFDAAALASAPGTRQDVGEGRAPAGRAAAPRAGAGRSARGWVGRVLWHPAFAYALVALLAVPLVRAMLPKLSLPRVKEETRIVDARPAPPAAPKVAEAPAAQAPAEAKKMQAPAPIEGAPRSRDATGGLAARRTDEAAASSRRPEASDEPPALADAAPAAAPTSRAVGGGAPAPLVLELRGEKPTVYAADVLGRPVTLRVRRPSDLPPGPLVVTVRGRADRREITAQASSADAIVLDMPPGWLAPGDYVVTLQPVAGGAPGRLGFTVRAPTGAR